MIRPKSAMRSYQNRTVTALYESNGLQAVLPMGAGKTATELTVICELIQDEVIRGALVLAPKRVAQLVWRAEAREWEHLQHLRFSLVSGTKAQREKALRRTDVDIWLCGIDNTQWLTEELKLLPPDHPIFGLLAIDELSRFKNPTGKRGQALSKIVTRFGIRHGLTGTPRPNGYMDQWMPSQILGGARTWGRSFYSWRKRHFMQDFQGFKWEVNPFAEDSLKAAIASFSLTMTDADMPDLPPLTVVDHWFDLPADARKTYVDMEKEFIAEFKADPVKAANSAVASGKLCQIANGFFYADDEDTGERVTTRVHDEKIQIVDDLVQAADGSPVLIVYGYEEDLEQLKALYPGLPYFGSGTTDRQADEYQRAWNAGDIAVMALHPASAAHGLNLQKSGHQMIMLDITWSAELYDQAIKRFWRPGQERHCFLHRIAARKTVDEVRILRVEGKITAQEAFRQYLRKV